MKTKKGYFITYFDILSWKLSNAAVKFAIEVQASTYVVDLLVYLQYER